MDIFAEDFDIDVALKEDGAEVADVLDKELSARLDDLKKRMDAGLKRNEFHEVEALQGALTAARNIVQLRLRSVQAKA